MVLACPLLIGVESCQASRRCRGRSDAAPRWCCNRSSFPLDAGLRQRHAALACRPHRRAETGRCRVIRPPVSSLAPLLPVGITPLQQDLGAAVVAMAGALACVKSCDALAQSGAVDRVRGSPSAPAPSPGPSRSLQCLYMSAVRRVLRASLCVVLRCVTRKAPREPDTCDYLPEAYTQTGAHHLRPGLRGMLAAIQVRHLRQMASLWMTR